MGEVTSLENLLYTLGVTDTTASKNKLTNLASLLTEGSSKTLNLGTNYSLKGTDNITFTILDQLVTDLTSLTNLTSLQIDGVQLTPSTKVEAKDGKEQYNENILQSFSHSKLKEIELAMPNLTLLKVHNSRVCVTPDGISNTTSNNLTTLKVDYLHSIETADSSLQSASVISSLQSLLDIQEASSNNNKLCSQTVESSNKDPKVILPENEKKCDDNPGCGGSSDTSRCIKQVEISSGKLVITTEDCSSSSVSTQSTNNPVTSDAQEVTYSKCTSCRNARTLLRNEVTETNDASSLYNRDSNNEVCNHCLVDVGGEKHCNKFLDKEDCNYLGDSYTWVGA